MRRVGASEWTAPDTYTGANADFDTDGGADFNTYASLASRCRTTHTRRRADSNGHVGRSRNDGSTAGG